MKENDDKTIGEHNVWIEFSCSRNKTETLAKLAREIMDEDTTNAKNQEENLRITFPSDLNFQDRVYRKLLERQRLKKMEEEELREQGLVLHDWNIIPAKNPKAPFCAPDAARLARKEFLSGPGPVTWTVGDIAKAGCLLAVPAISTVFNDEQEMRRVYTLIYDVYRYKNILSQALDDVTFFFEHPELKEKIPLVWLLLYDLYHRSFKKRTLRQSEIVENVFPNAGLVQVESTVWRDKTKLAASVARLRIKHRALRLSQLLPHHLRDEKVCCRGRSAPVTCWINIKKIKSVEDLSVTIERLMKVRKYEEEKVLDENGFKFDTHCPQFIIFPPSMRTKLAQSALVQKHKLIVQDKSFCLGPATFGKIVSDLQLSGSVIQSHVNSPRTTAYLASLLSQNDNIKKLLAFSAGNKKKEYENYFNNLGIKNILIFSEKLIDLPPDSTSLEEAIAVFATPPNSYSAVSDPIDLVCSRGGDLSMLEVLTETEDTVEGRKRVASILEEQKMTLKFAMSRPQIQLVLYETHSEIDAENDHMVHKAVNEINKSAKLHHATIQGKLRLIQAQEENVNNEINNNDGYESIQQEQRINLLNEIIVPDCDLFNVPELPELCPNIKCSQLAKEGCYLALLQRKQVNRMDNKYMIQMAEARGLFGNEIKKSGKEKKKKVVAERVTPSPPLKIRRRVKEIEIGRITAPTHASSIHSIKQTDSLRECARRKTVKSQTQPKRWWTETTRHITSLRTSLSRQRVLPSSGADAPIAKKFVNNLVRRTAKVDEIVAKSSKDPTKVPLFPRLRLTRYTEKIENKIPIPIHVTMVTFPAKDFPISFY